MRPIALTVNGARHEAEVEPRELLVYFLRERLGLTGTNVGCDTSSCGACTVLLDGESVKSCTLLAVQADGREMTTIEGLAATASSIRAAGVPRAARAPVRLLHARHGAWPPSACCGRQPNPSEAEIRTALEGNLCRCTGYHNIVKRRAPAAATA